MILGHGCVRWLDTRYATRRHLGNQWTSQQIRQLFGNHLSRIAGAMHPPIENTIAQTEHGRRDSTLSVVSHVEDAKEEGRRVDLGLSELSHVSSINHDDSSCATASQDVAMEKASQGRQREDSGERMSSPFGQALGQWHGKGKHAPTVWSHHQRQGRDYRDQQVDPTATDDRRDTVSLTPECGWSRSCTYCRTITTRPNDCWRKPT